LKAPPPPRTHTHNPMFVWGGRRGGAFNFVKEYLDDVTKICFKIFFLAHAHQITFLDWLGFKLG